jgi:hypothetical protein
MLPPTAGTAELIEHLDLVRAEGLPASLVEQFDDAAHLVVYPQREDEDGLRYVADPRRQVGRATAFGATTARATSTGGI